MAFVGVSVAALAYLIVDIYPQVKSFRAIFLTISFWLLFIVYTVLNILAFGALSSTSTQKVQSLVGPSVALLALVLLSTFGTISILQSLALRVGDKKFMDVGGWIDAFRSSVLENCAKRDADLKKIRVFNTATNLAARYKGRADELKAVYVNVFGTRDNTELPQELTKMHQDATAMGVPYEQLLARRIVAADLDSALAILRRK